MKFFAIKIAARSNSSTTSWFSNVMEALKKLQFWIDLDSKPRRIGVFQNYLALWTVYLTETLVPRLENHSSFYRGEQSHAIFRLLFLQINQWKRALRLTQHWSFTNFNVSLTIWLQFKLLLVSPFHVKIRVRNWKQDVKVFLCSYWFWSLH